MAPATTCAWPQSTEQENVVSEFFSLITTKEVEKIGHGHGCSLLSVDVENNLAAVKHVLDSFRRGDHAIEVISTFRSGNRLGRCVAVRRFAREVPC
jgi:hypothetical protein